MKAWFLTFLLFQFIKGKFYYFDSSRSILAEFVNDDSEYDALVDNFEDLFYDEIATMQNTEQMNRQLVYKRKSIPSYNNHS